MFWRFAVRLQCNYIIHMCGAGNPAGSSCTCGSYLNPNNREFPAVPYSAWDFNDNKCNGEIDNYNDAYQVMREMMEIKNMFLHMHRNL